MERHIVGLGGGGDTSEQTLLLYDYVLALTGKPDPKLLYVPTAGMESAEAIVGFYERLQGRAQLSHLRTYPWPPANLRELILSQDAICVSGGSTANLLAIWRAHRIDSLLRDAWHEGVVLFGASAGMICWFEAGVTDSFGPELAGLDCLGFLPGSACPHYDAEPERRPRYRELIDQGFPEGVAADDGVALHYVGTELQDVVTCRPGTGAYRVTRKGEEQLSVRELF